VRRRERGSALLVAIVALVVVSVGAQALHAILVRDLRGLQAERNAVQLRALTDAALAVTLSRLSADPVVRGVPRQRLDFGFFESAVRAVGPGAVEVLATGEAGGRRSTVKARVALEPAGPRVVGWEPSAVGAFAGR
jgi:hypothetical protein